MTVSNVTALTLTRINLSEPPVMGEVRHYKRLQRALTLAQVSEMKQKHGAIYVRGGRVIAVGINTWRNEPLKSIPADAISNHAEVNCLSALSRNGTVGGTLYVARISSGGNISNSAPCRACRNYLIKWTGITRIIHT